MRQTTKCRETNRHMATRPTHIGKGFKALVATALVLLIAWIGKAVVVNTNAFNPLSTALDQVHFSDIYFHGHRGHNAEAEQDMVLVDIQYLHDREEIATLIDSISAQRPRVVALDVIFPQSVSLDPVADSHLMAAVAACPQVVLAQNAVPLPDGGWRMERSFFADDYSEGIVNMPASVVRYAEPRFDTLPTFAAQVTALSSANRQQPTASSLIDFGGANLMQWTPGAEDFYLPALTDKLVFVGDLGDLRDYHNIPVGAGGQSRMSGTEVHALATAALLSDNSYHTLPRWLGIVLQIIIIFLFCWLLYVLPQTMDNWVSGALQLVFMLLMLPVCYLFFVGLHIVCSPTLAIVGFGLAGLAKNIVDAIVKN